MIRALAGKDREGNAIRRAGARPPPGPNCRKQSLTHPASRPYVRPMGYSDATIKELMDFSDPVGVLSIYVGHTPRTADQKPAISTEINELLTTCIEAQRSADPGTAKLIERRLRELQSALAAMFTSRGGQRGHVAFIAIERADLRRFSVEMPFRNEVSFGAAPSVRQLLALRDAGQATGIVEVSRSGIVVRQWAFGQIDEVYNLEFEEAERSSATLAGPGGSNNSQGFRGDAHKDRFDDHFRENYERWLHGSLCDVIRVAEASGWQRIVVCGTPKLRDSAQEFLNSSAAQLRVLLADKSYENAPSRDIAEDIWPRLQADQINRDHDLAVAAINNAMSGGAGAIGMRNVCEALNEGRVSHLLIQDDVRATGFRSDEGTLHPEPGGLVAAADVPMHLETGFVDRMVEAAIRTNAEATIVPADDVIDLRSHDGVAALLRW